MNSLKYIISGIIGAGLGAFTTYILMKRQYDTKIQAELKEEMDKFKENYNENGKKTVKETIETDDISKKTRKLIEIEETNLKNDDKEVEEDLGRVERYKEYRKIAEEYPKNYEIERDFNERPSNHVYNSTPPYIFDPDDGVIPENYSDYDFETIYYNQSEGTFISEIGGLMSDAEVEDALGRENLIEFDKMIDEAREKGTITIENPPIIHIRNEKYEVDYEVAFNSGLY